MDRDSLKLALVALGSTFLLTACRETGTTSTKMASEGGAQSRTNAVISQQKEPAMTEKIIKTDEEWRKALTPEQFQVARKKGTEPAFTGQYWNSKGKGVYQCVCCGNDLFSSDTKFDSGTGWPSFWAPIGEGNVHTESDTSYGMTRNEVVCRRCDAHLGHVFDDGPAPTRQRYCINSASLQFKKKE